MAYIEGGSDAVDGWLDDQEARTLFALLDFQAQAPAGNILEIGAYHGKSAILLGFFVRANEHLVVSDLFEEDHDDDPEVRQEMARFYGTVASSVLLHNFRRFHSWEPQLLVGPSSETLSALPSSTFRLIHIDGSHRFEAVRADISHARRLLADGGVVVFDDLFTAHAPGVQAAVWEAVADGMVPLLMVGSSMQLGRQNRSISKPCCVRYHPCQV